VSRVGDQYVSWNDNQKQKDTDQIIKGIKGRGPRKERRRRGSPRQAPQGERREEPEKIGSVKALISRGYPAKFPQTQSDGNRGNHKVGRY